MRWSGHRDEEPDIARALPEYAEAGVLAAARAFKRSYRTINRIAEEHGIQFRTNTAQSRKSRQQARDRLAAQIARLAGTHTQAEICDLLGITRWVLRDTAEAHHIDINSRRR